MVTVGVTHAVTVKALEQPHDLVRLLVIKKHAPCMPTEGIYINQLMTDVKKMDVQWPISTDINRIQTMQYRLQCQDDAASSINLNIIFFCLMFSDKSYWHAFHVSVRNEQLNYYT